MDFIRIAGPSKLGIGFRLSEYHGKKGGPWSYDASHASLPLLPNPDASVSSISKKFESRLKLPAASAANLAVIKLLLNEPGCREGSVTLLPRKGYRIRRSIRLLVPYLSVRELGETYSVEWLQPRLDQLTDSEFAFATRLFLEMFEAPEIQKREFCAWDVGRKNKWHSRKLRRLSSHDIPAMALDEFQDRLTAYLKAKYELADSGRVRRWRPKDEDLLL